MAAEIDVPLKEGLTNPSGSATVMNPRANVIPPSRPLTLEPSSHHGRNTAVPSTLGSSTRIDVERPSHSLTPSLSLESDPSTFSPYFDELPAGLLNQIAVVHPPTTMVENQFRGRTSDSPAVQSNPEQMDRLTGHPQESGRSTPQTQIHHRTDVRHPALPSQLPTTTFATSYQWRDLLNTGLHPTDFDDVLSGVLGSPTEVTEVKGLNEADLQSVIDVLGTVWASFNPASTVLPSLKLPPPVPGYKGRIECTWEEML